MLKLPPLILLCLGAIYYGAMYGGSITAILLNIPGEVASVPRRWAYPLPGKEEQGGPCHLRFGVLRGRDPGPHMPRVLCAGTRGFRPFVRTIEYFGLMIFSMCCLGSPALHFHGYRVGAYHAS